MVTKQKYEEERNDRGFVLAKKLMVTKRKRV